MRSASLRASSTLPTERKVRPQQRVVRHFRRGYMNAIAACASTVERCIEILTLEIAIEGVGEQDDLLPLRRCSAVAGSALHAFIGSGDMDGRDEPGHDDLVSKHVRPPFRQVRRAENPATVSDSAAAPGTTHANSATRETSPHWAHSAAGSRPVFRAATSPNFAPAPPQPRSSCAPCRRRSGTRAGTPCTRRKASSSRPSRRRSSHPDQAVLRSRAAANWRARA